MRTRLLIIVALVALAGLLTGCSAEKPGEPTGSVTPTETATPTPTPGDPAAGISLAPGLYDQPDGTVLALGTLEYRDLEGGFWAVVDRTQAAGEDGLVVAVIANAGDFKAKTDALKGVAVVVNGRRLEGASIRMAGPEIVATSIEEGNNTPGPAE